MNNLHNDITSIVSSEDYTPSFTPSEFHNYIRTQNKEEFVIQFCEDFGPKELQLFYTELDIYTETMNKKISHLLKKDEEDLLDFEEFDDDIQNLETLKSYCELLISKKITYV